MFVFIHSATSPFFIFFRIGDKWKIARKILKIRLKGGFCYTVLVWGF